MRACPLVGLLIGPAPGRPAPMRVSGPGSSLPGLARPRRTWSGSRAGRPRDSTPPSEHPAAASSERGSPPASRLPEGPQALRPPAGATVRHAGRDRPPPLLPSPAVPRLKAGWSNFGTSKAGRLKVIWAALGRSPSTSILGKPGTCLPPSAVAHRRPWPRGSWANGLRFHLLGPAALKRTTACGGVCKVLSPPPAYSWNP